MHYKGVQGFKILYWLFSCDDTDKDTILCIIRGEYFSWVNISQFEFRIRTDYFGLVSIDVQTSNP